MDRLNIAENIVRLRHEKRMTQEQLAEFAGVTKASVSKWETGQSMPDIIILPRLAAFFDVTVDELIGYVPQLSKEQIQSLYLTFAAEFASCPFEEVMAKTKNYVKKYYSCYPFLFQICVLWLNHYSLGKSEESRSETLHSILELCGHIMEGCRDVRITDDTVVLQSIVWLQTGQTAEVIEALEEISKPYRLWGQSGAILVQAYRLEGKQDKAESFAQISMYNAIMSLIGMASIYISLRMDNLADCEPTIDRIGEVERIYSLAKVNPNQIAGFEYQAASCFARHGKKKEALVHAGKYVECLQELFASGRLLLRGDDYFDQIEEWFDETGTGGNPPRSRELVLEEVKRSFSNPLFAILEGTPEFEKIKKKLENLS